MRTTLNLDDAIMSMVKKRAAETGKTMTEIVEQALRNEVSGRPATETPFVLRWNAVAGRVQPGIDLADRDSLYRAMERDE
jgi:hypothetical protein